MSFSTLIIEFLFYKFDLQPRNDDFRTVTRDWRVHLNKNDHENMRYFRFFIFFFSIQSENAQLGGDKTLEKQHNQNSGEYNTSFLPL